MDEIQERKISKQDIALFIKQMRETPGWKILDAWLQMQLTIHREELEETLDPISKGRVKMLKEIYQQLKEYEHD